MHLAPGNPRRRRLSTLRLASPAPTIEPNAPSRLPLTPTSSSGRPPLPICDPRLKFDPPPYSPHDPVGQYGPDTDRPNPRKEPGKKPHPRAQDGTPPRICLDQNHSSSPARRFSEVTTPATLRDPRSRTTGEATDQRSDNRLDASPPSAWLKDHPTRRRLRRHLRRRYHHRHQRSRHRLHRLDPCMTTPSGMPSPASPKSTSGAPTPSQGRTDANGSPL